FYKNNTKVGELKGANPAGLEAAIKQHQGPVDGEGGAPSSNCGYSDLQEFIILKQVECLNQKTGNDVQNVFKNDNTFLESDCDEQLIISIPFNQAVKVHSIKFVAPEGFGPKSIKTFVNLPSTPSFEEAEESAEVETLELKEGEIANLRFVKYQFVHSLQFFITGNFGDNETTKIQRLTLFGVPCEVSKMDKWEKK
ncbi:Thioredoxin-like protein 1, partial [Lobulomyces angularis]